MEFFPAIGAIVVAILEIISIHDIRDRLEKDHPEVSSRDYYPSYYLMILLIVAEIGFLIRSIFNH